MKDVNVSKVLFSQEEIIKRVKELGDKITADYDGQIILIGILKGSVIFLSDLSRYIKRDVRFSFMEVSTYGDGSVSQNVLNIKKDLDIDISGADVLIVEDIVDTGFTLSELKKELLKRNPKSLKICTAFNKPSRRTVPIDVDYIGFDIPDEFIVGYGLDYAQKYRNLPYLGVVEGV